jgi:hypothetical protein
LIGFLAKLAEQILLHGRSKTGSTSLHSPLYPGRGEEPTVMAVTRCIRGSNNSALTRGGGLNIFCTEKVPFCFLKVSKAVNQILPRASGLTMNLMMSFPHDVAAAAVQVDNTGGQPTGGENLKLLN